MLHNMTIEQIPLSVRSYNALKNHGIENVENLMALTEVELKNIRNLGAKSIQEIVLLQQRIKSGDHVFIRSSDKNTTLKSQLVKELVVIHQIPNYRGGVDYYQVKVLNLFNEWVDNVYIDELKLSVRPTNCLFAAGIKTFQDLINLTIQNLSELPNMGQKSVNEILTCLYSRTHVSEANGIGEALNPIIDYFRQDTKYCHSSLNKQAIISRTKYIFSTLEKKQVDYVLSLIEMNCQVQMDSILDEYIYSDSVVISLLKNYVITLLENERFIPIKNQEIVSQMPVSIQKNSYVQTWIDELVREKRIEYFENGIRIIYPSILEYVESISRPNAQAALARRLKGETLEEIGCDLNITRERVRQIIIKLLKQRPAYVKEDEYRFLYEKYAFTKTTFLNIFKVGEYVWNYLKITYTMGELPLEALLEEKQITNTIRKRVHHEVYRDYLHIDDKLIKKNRREISRYLISKYCKQVIDIEVFWEIYHNFIIQYKLDEDERLNYPLRSMENYISDYDCVVWRYGRKFRYYPIKTYDFEVFFKQIQWEQYQNVEISTYKIFCDYPEIMSEYDIRDEYELHNIIKKLPTDLVGEQVKILPMPYLAFGECDRGMQVIELLLELAPITRDELAKAFEEKYGHRKETVSGYFSTVIDDYFYDGIYRVDEVPLSQDEFMILKEQLKEEFYFIDDVKKIYLDLFPNGDTKKVNAYNIKQLGFKVNSNYLFSNQYNSADSFFRNLLTSNDKIDLTGNYSRLWNIQNFFVVTKELREKFEILEYAPSRFINYRRLEQLGITKNHLTEYVEGVLKFVNDEYFTIHSLRLKGHVHELDELGFDEWFYSSLICQDVSIQYRRFKDKILLKKQEDKISLANFIEELLQTLISIDIYDFIDWVKEMYGLELNRTRLLEVIKTTSLHYDSIMEKIYLNYETYYQEV